MVTQKYTEFRKNNLPDIYNSFLGRFSSELQEKKYDFTEIVKKQLKMVIDNVITIQKQVPLSVNVGCIQISLLLSSLANGRPEVMYEVYDSNKEFGDLLYTQCFEVDGVFDDWLLQKNVIEKKITELKQQAYLGPEAVNTLFLESYKNLLYLLAFSMKYDFGHDVKLYRYDELEKDEEFYISFGEYRGWYRLLYKDNPAKDFLQARDTKDFSFSIYEKYSYKNNRIIKLELNNTYMDECVYVNTVFKNVNFRDSIFKKCVFRDCTFEGCSLDGVLFDQCDMKEVKWLDNSLKGGLCLEENQVVDICRPAIFDECILHNLTFTGESLDECIKDNCDEEQIEVIHQD